MNHDVTTSVSANNRPEASTTVDSSRRHRWAFRWFAVAMSLAPLLVIEAILRVSGSPTPEESAWVELHQLKPLFELDDSKTRWQIPSSRSNFFRPASFPASKASETRRIFVLGGSTVQGRPWATETAFSTWLRFRLESADPERTYEVINCGGISYASYRIERILDEVLRHSPDAIVIYTGHNEFLEDRTYAETRNMSAANRFATRIAQNVRIVDWVSRLTRGEPHATKTVMNSEVDAALDHTESLREYHRDPIWRRAVERHFDETFRRILTKCRLANVMTIVCQPASDLVNTPPFKSAPSLRRETERPLAKELASLEAFIQQHEGSADAHFRLGRQLYESGQTDRAAKHLTTAKDEDICPLRATTPIVESVRSISEQQDIIYVPTVALLDTRDAKGNRVPDGIADPEFFVDHVHPTIAGHQRIAESIAGEFRAIGWGNQDDVADDRYRARVVKHMSTLDEAYFARGKQRLEGLQRWASGRAASIGLEQ